MNATPPSHPQGGRRGLAALLSLGLIAGTPGPAAAGDFKCWKGSDGEMQCGEVMPPEQKNLPATVYDGRGRRVNPVVPPPEPPGDSASSKPLRPKEQRSEADRALLLTFPTLSDLTAARDHELEAIDTLIATEHLNVRGQESVLNRLRTQAGDLERAGRTVPRELLDKIERADRGLSERRAAADRRTQEKESVAREYTQKIERFRRLKGLPETSAAPEAGAAETAPLKTPTGPSAPDGNAPAQPAPPVPTRTAAPP